MYQIVVERSAEKDLKKLSSEIRPRAIAAIQALAKNPRPSGSRKLAGTENDWRIRVGDYRIVYEIAEIGCICAGSLCEIHHSIAPIESIIGVPHIEGWLRSEPPFTHKQAMRDAARPPSAH